MSRARMLTVLLVAVGALALGAAVADADWTTYHADPALSAVDHSSGAPLPFAAAWTTPAMTGTVWAEPLVYRGLVLAATENNDLYAFDEATGAPVWHVNLGAPVPSSELPCGDISPTVGITSTPVIDPATGVVYAVADVRSGASAVHTLVALNAATGATIFSRSVEPPGDVPLNQLQRESLTLDQGRVLVGYGGNDGDCAQYKGYLVSAPADDSGPNDTYTVPTSREGAIWSGGGAPAVDSAGDVFVATGNATDGPGQPFDHGDTVEKLTALATETDYWAPSTWAQDSASDADLGSVSPELLDGNLLYQGSKNGNGYLVSTTAMGQIGGERYSAPVCRSFGADAYANGILYVACADGVRALDIDATGPSFTLRWTGPSDANGPPIVAGGLVWVTSTNDAKLYGLDPATGAVRVTQATAPMEHFTTPAASDGKLFLATGSQLSAYTIAAASPPAPPSPVSPPLPVPPPAPVAPAPPHRAATLCHAGVALSLTVPKHGRIVKVAVYDGHRRLLVRRGRRLRHVALARLTRRSHTLRLIETPRRGHRVVVTRRIRDCHRVARRHHHHHRTHGGEGQPPVVPRPHS